MDLGCTGRGCRLSKSTLLRSLLSARIGMLLIKSSYFKEFDCNPEVLTSEYSPGRTPQTLEPCELIGDVLLPPAALGQNFAAV
jgi:hypothetical protein